MVKSLYTGVSGMKTHQWRMDVIGNNISNVNTVGFKSDVPVFKDTAYMTKRTPSGATANLGGINPSQVGYGVGMNSVTANMTQAGYTSSDNIWDMSIVGNGFFQVMDGAGNIYYTRAGNFKVDDSGYVTNANGYHVLGTNGNTDGQPAGSEILRVVIPDTNAHTSSATKRINNTNVTVTVTTPSDHTDMSVTFNNSTFPYATYSNGILNVFFNQDAQYNSQDDFDKAIQAALDAGGINLPDDVELKIDIEDVPDDINAVAAKNKIEEGFDFTTDTATVEFHANIQTQGGNAGEPVPSPLPTNYAGGGAHAYISFSVADPKCRDTVKLNVVSGTNAASATYTAGAAGAAGAWEINVRSDSTRADIQKLIDDVLDNNTAASKLSVKSFVIPVTDNTARGKALTSISQDGGTAAVTKPMVGAPTSAPLNGKFELKVLEAGEFGKNYKTVFSYVSGYGKTKASWDENTLNIQICADSTIAEVNKAIKDASRGNADRVVVFKEIEGLKYGTYSTADTTIDYMGNTVEGTGATAVYKDANGNTIASSDYVLPATATAADATKSVWAPGIREAFFGGNPSVTPKDGKDAFYTQVAKSLSTFNLQDGRTGDEQNLDTITDYMIQADGTILAKHAIHGTIVVGRIDLVTFDNPNGLQKVGGTNFAATVASGDPHVKIATQDGAGEVVAGTLEMSNVDLADEFTNMITTQRGYQANSRVITVSDTMIEELLSLKR